MKVKDTLYILIFMDYVFTLVYLIRHTTKFGVILIMIFSILVAIAAKISLGEDNNENK